MEGWTLAPMLLDGLERLIWLLAVCPAVYLALFVSRWMSPSLQRADRRRN